jgi:hypothetical protein
LSIGGKKILLDKKDSPESKNDQNKNILKLADDTLNFIDQELTKSYKAGPQKNKINLSPPKESLEDSLASIDLPKCFDVAKNRRKGIQFKHSKTLYQPKPSPEELEEQLLKWVREIVKMWRQENGAIPPLNGYEKLVQKVKEIVETHISETNSTNASQTQDSIK